MRLPLEAAVNGQWRATRQVNQELAAALVTGLEDCKEASMYGA